MAATEEAPAPKPVTVVVPGVFHVPAHYRALIAALKAHGHTVLCPALATVGPDDSIDDKSHLDDARRIRESLLPYLDAGAEAVIVAHSYGAIPATGALEGETVAERRARGLPGGVVGVVYLAGVAALVKGASLLEPLGGKFRSLNFHSVEGPKLGLIEDTAEVLFHDIEPEVRQEAVMMLCPSAHKPFHVPIPYTIGEVTVPKWYVLGTQDRAMDPPYARSIAERGGATIVEVDSGHSAFLKEGPRETIVQLVLEAHATHGKVDGGNGKATGSVHEKATNGTNGKVTVTA